MLSLLRAESNPFTARDVNAALTVSVDALAAKSDFSARSFTTTEHTEDAETVGAGGPPSAGADTPSRGGEMRSAGAVAVTGSVGVLTGSIGGGTRSADA